MFGSVLFNGISYVSRAIINHISRNSLALLDFGPAPEDV